MMSDGGPPGPIEADPHATRIPGPESLEAMAAVGRKLEAEAVDDEGRARGVGLDEFRRGLIEFGFLDAGQLRAFEAGCSAEAGGPPTDSEGLARALVRLGKLTRYQASALFQGKGRALRIGPYVVLDKLGSGGMGMVFKARPSGDAEGSEVALKLLPPSASKHPQAVLRFRREAAIMARLDHPNIVASHDIGSSNGVHYLVMDYVEGRDLERVIRSGGPMKVPRAVDCLIQAARGLVAAHERGIVHRDIKPANLLLDSQGAVRILDLGLARITRAEDIIEGEAGGPSLTASGIIMGTVDFLPPEQSDDSKRADHRADIYSLACTLHFLLTGKPPFSGETVMQRLVAHHRKPIPSLAEARPEVPPELDAIFRSMMAKAPEDRPSTMLEALERLEAWRASPAGARSLRVFDVPKDPTKPGPPPTTRDEPARPPSGVGKPADSGSYDLMTNVRAELFEPDPDGTVEAPLALPARRSKGFGKGLRAKADIALRCLVAAAAIVVLIRFFPTSSASKAKVKPDASESVEESPPLDKTVVEEPAQPEPQPTAIPTAPAPVPPSTKAEGPPPPPPPPILDRLFGPPRREGEGPPPRPGDGPPGPRPGGGRPPLPGTVPKKSPSRPTPPADTGQIPF